jgi:hypothetical protein
MLFVHVPLVVQHRQPRCYDLLHAVLHYIDHCVSATELAYLQLLTRCTTFINML